MVSIILPVALFVVLTILWTIDMAQTVFLVDHEGTKVEENPVARKLLKRGDNYFIAFKIVDLFVLGLIVQYLVSTSMFLGSMLLVMFIGLYIMTVVHNNSIIKGSGDY